MERHWIDDVADLISGRIYNAIMSHNERLTRTEQTMHVLGEVYGKTADTMEALIQAVNQRENTMSENEQKILDAAQRITELNQKLDAGIENLLAKIDATPGVEREDFSEELAALTNAIGGTASIANKLTPATEPGPAQPANPPITEEPLQGGPIVHDPNAPATPLGGPTDAGVPTEVPQPGTVSDTPVPTTPLAENAQNEANPNVPADDGTVPSTDVEAPVATWEDPDESEDGDPLGESEEGPLEPQDESSPAGPGTAVPTTDPQTDPQTDPAPPTGTGGFDD